MDYAVPAASVMDEQVVKRSRFISHVHRVENKQQALDNIQYIKQQYPDARHHCWAYIAGHPTTGLDVAMSDDGEPQGTAGKPIFNVLQYSGVGEVALVVVRYFGGIKLGAGGLLRAYSSSARLVTKQLVCCTTLDIRFHYALESKVQHFLKGQNMYIQQTCYVERIHMLVAVPVVELDAVCVALTNLTSGQITLSFEASSTAI
ncbi:MAG: YigZ family protein [Mariprofundaceae bacterium]|nr:YigZ family protein [Mariprofundaceae bacterium]